MTTTPHVKRTILPKDSLAFCLGSFFIVSLFLLWAAVVVVCYYSTVVLRMSLQFTTAAATSFFFLNRADEAGRPEEFIVRGLALVLEWIWCSGYMERRAAWLVGFLSGFSLISSLALTDCFNSGFRYSQSGRRVGDCSSRLDYSSHGFLPTQTSSLACQTTCKDFCFLFWQTFRKISTQNSRWGWCCRCLVSLVILQLSCLVSGCDSM